MHLQHNVAFNFVLVVDVVEAELLADKLDERLNLNLLRERYCELKLRIRVCYLGYKKIALRRVCCRGNIGNLNRLDSRLRGLNGLDRRSAFGGGISGRARLPP
jgi:hypothetical protein